MTIAIALTNDECRVTAVALAHAMEAAFVDEPDRYDICQDALAAVLSAMEAEGLVKEETA